LAVHVILTETMAVMLQLSLLLTIDNLHLEAVMKMAVENMAWVCDILQIVLGLLSWWLLTMFL